MHVAGVKADARTFEHIDPELVGNSRDVLISELSGSGSVLSRAEGAGIDLDADAAKRAVERLKEREHLGYQYEAADASFELLLRRETGAYEPLFRLEGFRVITEKRADGKVETEATIKIWVDGRRYVRTAEGNGPGERARPCAARGDHRAPSAPGRDRAGQLQGEDPGRAPRDRRGHAGPPGLLGRARDAGGRSASPRTSSRRRGRRSSTRSSTPSSREAASRRERSPAAEAEPSRCRPRRVSRARADPARPAGPRRARGGAGARGDPLGAALAGAGAGALRARLRRLARGRGRGRRLVGHRAPCISGFARSAGAPATR